jgi:flavin-dependent dehydrogenase
MYDAIVVGARCGGSPTAMLLAHRGYRVLLVDRASFPSDAVSAHHVTVPGVARLARWGLLEAVAASGCPPIRRMTVRLGDHTFEGTPAPVDGIGDQYCVRRTILDTILVGAAAEAGAEVREGFVVEELLFDGDRVAGVRGRGPGASGRVSGCRPGWPRWRWRCSPRACSRCPVASRSAAPRPRPSPPRRPSRSWRGPRSLPSSRARR